MGTIAVDDKVVERLIETRDLLDELLETIDVLADEKLMLAIKESEEEVERGETRPLKEFTKDLGL